MAKSEVAVRQGQPKNGATAVFFYQVAQSAQVILLHSTLLILVWNL